MGKLEMEMKQQPWFPRVYLRYVDDVIAVVDKNDEKTLQYLNAKHEAINFTQEVEVDSKIAFLDLMLHRENNKITIDIFRKETDKPLCIPYTSHHYTRHKHAVFESLFFRLCNLPLNNHRHDKELKYVLEMGRINGFYDWKIMEIYKKHRRMSKIGNFTKLMRIREKKRKTITLANGRSTNKMVILPFYAPITNKLHNIMTKHNLNVVYKNEGTLRSLIGVKKDKKQDEECSGIYQIPCQDCDMIYVGQTKRRFEIRESEHEEAIKNNMLQKSSVALHCREQKHRKGRGKIVKRISNPIFLDPWESLYMEKSDKLMNTGEPPITSSLFARATTPAGHIS
jgi:hypothetical protein